MDVRFAGVDAKFADLRTEMGTGFAGVDAKFADLRTEMGTGLAGIDSKTSSGLHRQLAWIVTVLITAMGIAMGYVTWLVR